MEMIKCPVCKHDSCEYEEYREDVGGAFIIVEEYKYCDKCGYTLEMAYSPAFIYFSDIKRGSKDFKGVYHEKNLKRHKRIRRKYADMELVKAIKKDVAEYGQ